MEKQLSLVSNGLGGLSMYSKLENNYWSWFNVFLSLLMAYGAVRFAVDAVRLLRWLCSRSPIEKKSVEKKSVACQTFLLETAKSKELETAKIKVIYLSLAGEKFHLSRACTGVNAASSVSARSLCLKCEKAKVEWAKVE